MPPAVMPPAGRRWWSRRARSFAARCCLARKKTHGDREAPHGSKCADWRAIFPSDKGEKTQQYFVYCKFLKRSQAGKEPSGCVRRSARRFPYKYKTGPGHDGGKRLTTGRYGAARCREHETRALCSLPGENDSCRRSRHHRNRALLQTTSGGDVRSLRRGVQDRKCCLLPEQPGIEKPR